MKSTEFGELYPFRRDALNAKTNIFSVKEHIYLRKPMNTAKYDACPKHTQNDSQVISTVLITEKILACQPIVTDTSCCVYKVIMDL